MLRYKTFVVDYYTTITPSYDCIERYNYINISMNINMIVLYYFLVLTYDTNICV